MNTELSEYQILDWYVAAGVDETICDNPVNRFEQTEKEKQQSILRKPQKKNPQEVYRPIAIDNNVSPLRSASVKLSEKTNDAMLSAKNLAMEAKTLDELRDAIQNFDGCSLKLTATNMVFGAGSHNADVMFIGEAPGADEDREGIPFIGRSGQLLEKMMHSAGLSREENAYISNIINWRPPGNRSPTLEETAICLPFIERHIELIEPKVIVLLGASAANALLEGKQSISRIRGKWFDVKTSLNSFQVASMPTFHPAYLLRSSAQKKGAWHDLIKIKKRLEI